MYGAFYLVVVDYREDSINYLNSVTFTLDDRNMKSVLVPPGYLNGHLCLSNECVFHYTQSYPNDYVDSQRPNISQMERQRFKHYLANR